jgi:hypothetical protein
MRNRKGVFKTAATFRCKIRMDRSGITIKFVDPPVTSGAFYLPGVIEHVAANLNFTPKVERQTQRRSDRGVTYWLVVAARFARTLLPREIFSCARSCAAS